MYRFPIDNKPRECGDQTSHCQRWSSNGACALNKTFVTRFNFYKVNIINNNDIT